LGFGLRSFTGAKLQAGFEIFSRYAELKERIKAAQVVITGEGSIDESTLMGKGVGEIARLCGNEGVPCVGLAGVLNTPAGATSVFSKLYAMAPEFVPVQQAMSEPAKSLERLAASVAASWRLADFC
jgi:glycerate kinase